MNNSIKETAQMATEVNFLDSNMLADIWQNLDHSVKVSVMMYWSEQRTISITYAMLHCLTI